MSSRFIAQNLNYLVPNHPSPSLQIIIWIIKDVLISFFFFFREQQENFKSSMATMDKEILKKESHISNEVQKNNELSKKIEVFWLIIEF